MTSNEECDQLRNGKIRIWCFGVVVKLIRYQQWSRRSSSLRFLYRPPSTFDQAGLCDHQARSGLPCASERLGTSQNSGGFDGMLNQVPTRLCNVDHELGVRVELGLGVSHYRGC